MPTKSGGVDPAALKQWISEARKKPIGFAMLLGGDGIVMQASKVKSPEQMRKAAKAAGGGAKGAWGLMSVQGKLLNLTYEGNPPGGFVKQVRKMLADAGQSMKVEMTPLSETEVEADAAGADPAPPASEKTAAGTDAPEEDEDAELDLAETLKVARKRPLSFACMIARGGVVLQTHRRKPAKALVKLAKAAGGSAKGAWGTMTVDGKLVVLSCAEDPPRPLARLLKLHLRDNGLKFAVSARGPSGAVSEDAAEDEDDAAEFPHKGADVAAAPPEATPGPGPHAKADGPPSANLTVPPAETSPDTPEGQVAALAQTYGAAFSPQEWEVFARSLEAVETLIAAGESEAARQALEDLARATAVRAGVEAPREAPSTPAQALARAETAVNAVRGQLDDKQKAMFKKLLDRARALYSSDGRKVDAILKLVHEKLDALDLTPDAGAAPSVALGRAPPPPPDNVGALTDLVSDARKGEIDAWIETYGEYDNAWQLGDDEGGEYLAEALRGENADLGDLSRAEKVYLAKATSALWRDADGSENRFEAFVEVGRDDAAREALAMGFASHRAETERLLLNGPVLDSPDGANAEAQMLTMALRLDPKATLQVFEGMEGQLARHAAGQHQDLHSMVRQRDMLDLAASGEVRGAAADKMVTTLFMSSGERDMRHEAYRTSMATALSKVAVPDPDAQEAAAGRLKGLFDERGVREMMFGEGIPPELRNWALAQAANDPDWTPQKAAEGWESAFVAQAAAAPIMAQHEARGTAPHVLRTAPGDRQALRNSLGQALNIAPDRLPPDDETPEAREAREAAGLDHDYYGPNPQIDKIAGKIAAEGGDPANMTVIPVVVTSNEFGVAKFTVFRLDRADGGVRFVDSIGDRFDDFDHWHDANQLPPGKMTYPKDLVLGAGLVTENTPRVTDTFLEWLGVVGDAVALTAGIAAGVIAIAGSGGLATPLVVGAAGAAAWQVGRAGQRLAGDHARGRDITDLSDPNVRSNWIDAGAGVLSIGALGAVAHGARAANAGVRVSGAMARTTAGLQVAANGADAIAVGNQAHLMATNWDRMSAGDKAMGLLNIAFWGGMSAASTTSGGAMMRDATSFAKLRNQAEFGSVFEVRRNADLSPSQIRVAYDADMGGAPGNIRIETGGGRVPPEILDLHTAVGRQMEFTGRMKAQLDSLLSGRPDPPSGSAAWEARLEIQKIDAEGEALRLRLEARGAALPEAEIGRIRARQEELAAQAQFQKGRLDDWARVGEGWVASAETGNSWAAKNGLPMGDDIAGHVWVLRGDPPPHLRRIDPDAKPLKWDRVAKEVVEVDDTPIDIDALIAEARARAANVDAPPDTAMTPTQATESIARYRETHTVTDSRGGTGTVSVTEVGGKQYVGVNSTNFDEAAKKLAKAWETKLDIPAGSAGTFERAAIYHAEAHTLMQIYSDLNGNMPKNLTIYVDRIACSSCQQVLPTLIKEMQMESLTIVLPDGRRAVVSDGEFVGDWQ